MAGISAGLDSIARVAQLLLLALQAPHGFGDHSPHDLQTLRGDLVHGVGILMPRRIIEVDQVERRSTRSMNGMWSSSIVMVDWTKKAW